VSDAHFFAYDFASPPTPPSVFMQRSFFSSNLGVDRGKGGRSFDRIKLQRGAGVRIQIVVES